MKYFKIGKIRNNLPEKIFKCLIGFQVRKIKEQSLIQNCKIGNFSIDNDKRLRFVFDRIEFSLFNLDLFIDNNNNNNRFKIFDQMIKK